MANECNRNIVEKYIFHKLTKQGYVWEFDVDLEEEEEEEEVARNGSVVAPPPTLVRRFGGADTTGPEEEEEEEENVPHLPERRAPPQQQRQQQRADPRAAAIHRVLREAGDELERLYQADFAEMSRQLYLTSTTAQRKFKAVVDELFRDGVNWGRIIAFFEFGATVCAECAGKEMTSQVDHIAGWMTEYLNGPLNSWIQDNGGWEAFVELYDRQRESVFSCSWPSIKAVFGLAALGAASLTIGAYLTQK